MCASSSWQLHKVLPPLWLIAPFLQQCPPTSRWWFICSEEPSCWERPTMWRSWETPYTMGRRWPIGAASLSSQLTTGSGHLASWAAVMTDCQVCKIPKNTSSTLTDDSPWPETLRPGVLGRGISVPAGNFPACLWSELIVLVLSACPQKLAVSSAAKSPSDDVNGHTVLNVRFIQGEKFNVVTEHKDGQRVSHSNHK